MTAIKSRLARLEAQRPPEPVKPALVFTWYSEKDDAALAEMRTRAEDEGRILFVVQFVEPPPREACHAEH
jgi:hypothetical protein